MVCVCRYVDKMDTSDRSLTIKIKICHLISSLMQHHMDLNFRAEVQFRNQVAEYLAMWVRGEVVTSENLSHVETLQKLVRERELVKKIYFFRQTHW